MACEKCNGKASGRNKLCARCAKVKEKVESAKNIVVSDLLLYADTHRHGSSADALVRAIAGYYDSDEVTLAKDTLVYHFAHTNVLHGDMTVHRQNSSNRSDDMANAEDVIRALAVLDDNDVDVTFVTEVWGKSPKSSPESMTDAGISERLAQLEAKFLRYDNRLTDISTDLTSTKHRVSDVEDLCAVNGDQLQQLVNSAVMDKSVKKQTNQTMADVVRAHDHIITSGSSDHNNITVSAAASEASNASKTSTAGHQMVDSDGFQLPRHHQIQQMREFRNKQRMNLRAQYNNNNSNTQQQQQQTTAPGGIGANQRPKRQGVMGQASGTGIQATVASREFFVTYVNKECDIDIMRQYIHSKGITERSLTIREGEDYNSFVLKVSVDEVAKVKDPDNWPTGVFVRKFYPSKNK